MKMKNILFLLAIALVLSAGACSKTQDPTINLADEPKADYTVERDELFEKEKEKLIKAPNGSVYYLHESKRYIFPNDGTYKSWFANFDEITNYSEIKLGEIEIGGNVTYKPGSRLLMTESDFNIYFVDMNSTLRPLDEDVAEQIYGKDWKTFVDEIENFYFTNYSIGDAVTMDNIPEIDPDLKVSAALYK